MLRPNPVEAKEILGLDIGLKRAGIARASNVARLAEPLMSLSTGDLLKSLKQYVAEYQVEAMVIGLPRNLSGEDTDQTTWVRRWTDRAKRQITTPLYFQDEALTSKLAKAKVQGSKISDQRHDEHALAAAIILQDFLDSSEADRIVA